MIQKKLPEPHNIKEKKEKKMYVMFSVGQYRSTEKAYKLFWIVSENNISTTKKNFFYLCLP